jgi:hypothetical protein
LQNNVAKQSGEDDDGLFNGVEHGVKIRIFFQEWVSNLLLPFQKGEREKACAGEEGFSTQIFNFVSLTKLYETL